MNPRSLASIVLALLLLSGCTNEEAEPLAASQIATPERTAPEPGYSLTADQTHNRFSRAIEPVLRVPSGKMSRM